MVNQSVSEAVNKSAEIIMDEIGSLQAGIDNQLKGLSEKTTRQHIEAGIVTKDEFERISTKLHSLER